MVTKHWINSGQVWRESSDRRKSKRSYLSFKRKRDLHFKSTAFARDITSDGKFNRRGQGKGEEAK